MTTQQSHTRPPPSSHSIDALTILLIGGESAHARHVEAALHGAGVDPARLSVVERLDDGLQQLAHGQVDVVVMNAWLPDSSGAAGVWQLRQDDPQTPVVVVAPRSSEAERALVLEAGAQDYTDLERLAPAGLALQLARAVWGRLVPGGAQLPDLHLFREMPSHFQELARLRQALREECAARESSTRALGDARARLQEADRLESAFERMKTHLEQRGRDFAQLTERLLGEIERRRELEVEIRQLRGGRKTPSTSVDLSELEFRTRDLRSEVRDLRRALSRVAGELQLAQHAQHEVELDWQRRRQRYDRDVRELRTALAEAQAAKARLEGQVSGDAGGRRPPTQT